MSKEMKLELGNAIPEAWDAAHAVAKSMRKKNSDAKWSRIPWKEIRSQLRRTGSVVDTTAVPVTWTNESPQMTALLTILEQAGFKHSEHVYYWESPPAAS
jgi:hypothetical protein